MIKFIAIISPFKVVCHNYSFCPEDLCALMPSLMASSWEHWSANFSSLSEVFLLSSCELFVFAIGSWLSLLLSMWSHLFHYTVWRIFLWLFVLYQLLFQHSTCYFTNMNAIHICCWYLNYMIQYSLVIWSFTGCSTSSNNI